MIKFRIKQYNLSGQDTSINESSLATTYMQVQKMAALKAASDPNTLKK